MSEVLMPNGGEGQLRITAGTEAFAMLTYMNNKDKWEATFDWHFRNPNTTTKCPRYSKTKPTENVKFKAKYSDSQTGTPTGEVGVRREGSCLGSSRGKFWPRVRRIWSATFNVTRNV